MDDKLVSVIIPVYNVEKYVEKCIKSVLNQSLKSIEIIIVNDGSTDKSKDIVTKISTMNNNIKVINQKNNGLSEARNVGIKSARGKYIFLLDSDDYLEKHVLENMVNRAEKDDADIVIGKFNFVYENNDRKKSSVNWLDESLLVNNVEAIKELLLLEKFQFHACGKLYKRELFKKIYFPKNKYFEDLATTYKLIYKAKKIVYINESCYEYLIRKGSICNSSFEERHLDFINHIDDMEKFFKDEKIYDFIEEFFVKMKINMYINLGFNKVALEENKKIRDEKLIVLKSKILNELNNSDIKLNKRYQIYRWIINKNLNIYPYIIKGERKIINIIRRIK